MTAPIAACATHGFVAGETCPRCGGGERLLSGDRRRRLSTFVSGALRHFPEDAGLALADAGWTPFGDLVDAVSEQYGWADAEVLAAVIETDPKGRFEWTGRDDATPGSDDGTGKTGTTEYGRVRAAYGHSVDVDLDAAETPVPETLYHGTAPRNVEAIREQGLRPMSRQRVHLSESVEAAGEVGARHAPDPVVLAVDAAAMTDAGHRIVKRGRRTYTTERVPPAYLSRVE